MKNVANSGKIITGGPPRRGRQKKKRNQRPKSIQRERAMVNVYSARIDNTETRSSNVDTAEKTKTQSRPAKKLDNLSRYLFLFMIIMKCRNIY